MHKSTRNLLLWGLGSAAALTLADAFLFERYAVRVRKFHYGPKACTHALRIVHISDMHLEGYPLKIKDLQNTIRAQKADLILITGDFIDHTYNVDKITEFMEGLPRLTPKYAVMGNWDRDAGLREMQLRQLLQPYNCKLLANDSVNVRIHGITLSITGLDDSTLGHPDMEMAIASNKKLSKHHIVLMHNPGYFPTVENYLDGHENVHVDFVLAGHTHGGQITLPGVLFANGEDSGPYVSGWYQGRHTMMYVTKGTGTSRIPVRFNTRAEIVWIEYGV